VRGGRESGSAIALSRSSLARSRPAAAVVPQHARARATEKTVFSKSFQRRRRRHTTSFGAFRDIIINNIINIRLLCINHNCRGGRDFPGVSL